jgi:hypothetical protein
VYYIIYKFGSKPLQTIGSGGLKNYFCESSYSNLFEAFALSLDLETSRIFIEHKTISKGSRSGVGSLIVFKGLVRASKPVSGDLRRFFAASLLKTPLDCQQLRNDSATRIAGLGP